MFDRVVCISLARRSKRWEQFQQGIPADWPFPRPKRVRAVDGVLAKPPPDFAQATIPVQAGLHIGGVIPDSLQTTSLSGAWGCYRSHLRVLEDAITDDVEALLVFEDDAVFTKYFTVQLNTFLAGVPDDWDQIYLGGQHLDPDNHPPVAVNDDVLRCHNVNRTHAYAIHRRMMLDVYRTLSMLPASPLVAQELHIDHRLGCLHARRNVYAPNRWLVGQRAGKSDVVMQTGESKANWWNDFPVAEAVLC